jgi:hypothetical protein
MKTYPWKRTIFIAKESHVVKRGNFLHLSLEPTNGVLLYEDIHTEYHRLYGTVMNTPLQLGEFLSKEPYSCRVGGIYNFPWTNFSLYQKN